MQADLVRLAESIDAERAARLRSELGTRPLALLLGVAFPPLTPQAGWQADAVERIASLGWRTERRRGEALQALQVAFDQARSDGAADPGSDPGSDPIAEFRRAVWIEKARIALRELLPVELGGAELA